MRRTGSFISVILLASTIMSAMSASSQRAGQAPAGVVAPCVTPTDACAGWVTFGAGPARSMFYRTFSLDVPNARITRALIVVHGTNRNADHYFDTARAAAFLAGALEDTVVIAPHMIDRTDKPQENEVVWQSSWRTGGPSVADPNVTSFDFADEILRKVAKKATFPNLKSIVVTGHSAGGQFTNRYSMSNTIHDTLGVPITYVVANPSSYAWPDAMRPLAQDDADPVKAKDGWSLDASAAILPPHTNFTFGPFEAAKAPAYNTWPAGLEKRDDPRNGTYIAKMTDEQLRKQLVERPISFILGQVDTLPLGGFDSSATAMAQGPTRRARGEAFVKYVNEKMGAKHPIFIVPECGHNDRCMYTTDLVFPVLFPKG